MLVTAGSMADTDIEAEATRDIFSCLPSCHMTHPDNVYQAAFPRTVASECSIGDWGLWTGTPVTLYLDSRLLYAFTLDLYAFTRTPVVLLLVV